MTDSLGWTRRGPSFAAVLLLAALGTQAQAQEPPLVRILKQELQRNFGILKQKATQHWLAILEPAEVWCSDVFDWNRLFAHEGFKALDMVQRVVRRNGVELATTRCPIRLDGQILKSSKGAPRLGADTEPIRKEFSLT